ncbi:hypothetical protein F4778DRAFT_413806 [Xylariomycetidae sp. FL2044]|nr:hypothetical protein F4778DRAFT_413806 [Xylariomycetidae sp. FL2044]
MTAGFSFSFSGDDIEDDGQNVLATTTTNVNAVTAHPTATTTTPASAFPVAGKPLLPVVSHDLRQMLSELPSKVAYSTLDVDLDGNGIIRLPRRELWDVRVQIMAEDAGGEAEPGLGVHDVKTGVYEGGFKSWESSVDLVKVLSTSSPYTGPAGDDAVAPAVRVIELGCGTALPSLALFHWGLGTRKSGKDSMLSIILADYNPTVLQLVTLPNFILTWALHQRAETPTLTDAFYTEGEFEIAPSVIEAFQGFLSSRNISLRFFSGAWSPELVQLMSSSDFTTPNTGAKRSTVILGAETIYSPFALSSFTSTIFSLMEAEKAQQNTAEVLVGAKKLYFGVGGSLDDFVVKARELGAIVEQVREETDGVRRGVVRCHLPS